MGVSIYKHQENVSSCHVPDALSDSTQADSTQEAATDLNYKLLVILKL